jgi:diphthine-ammonia ligase
MKLAVLFSGGKDSAYAMYKAMQTDEVVCLISIISKNNESYMFHTPNIQLVELQAEAIGLPLIKKITEGKKEEELADLKAAILEAKERFLIEGIVTGAIESVYQSSRIQKICDDLKLACVNPLWKKDQIELLQEIVNNKFKVMISGVFAYGLSDKWLGREIDKNIIADLAKLKDKYQINPAGEGGEIETTVLDAPFFEKRLVVVDSEIKDNVFLIQDAKLVKK